MYCHVEFPFKFFDKMVGKKDILKIINLYFLCVYVVRYVEYQ